MKDLNHPRWMYLKAVLFVMLGLAGFTILLLESPSVRIGLLLAMTIWSFCRAYYFAFYVIEHYVDPSFRFSGLFRFVIYLWSKRRARN